MYTIHSSHQSLEQMHLFESTFIMFASIVFEAIGFSITFLFYSISCNSDVITILSCLLYSSILCIIKFQKQIFLMNGPQPQVLLCFYFHACNLLLSAHSTDDYQALEALKKMPLGYPYWLKCLQARYGAPRMKQILEPGKPASLKVQG